MGKRVVIAGAGGFGRGVYSWLRSSQGHLERMDVTEIVFLDDCVTDAPGPVVGKIKDYTPDENDEAICALGVPASRLRLVHAMKMLGVRFHTFIDDRAVIAEGVRIGVGAVICPGVVISADVSVGEQVHVNFNCCIGHDTTLGAFTTLSPAVNIMGEVRVGDAVFLGGNAVVLPRIELGNRVVVGAGAVVVRTIEPGLTVVGNPSHPTERGATEWQI